MDTLNVTDRFDGAVYWAMLDEEDRATIGAATLEWMVAHYVQQTAYEDGGDLAHQIERIGMAAGDVCRDAILEVFVDAITRDCLETADGAPRIPSLLGMVCRDCGCSERDPCTGGCGWAADSLCTRCLQQAVAP